jgi:hypothetical protein
MGKESSQKDTDKIIAAVTLPNHKVQSGNAFVVEAANEDEQEKVMLDLAKALKRDVTRTSNGIYLLIRD